MAADYEMSVAGVRVGTIELDLRPADDGAPGRLAVALVLRSDGVARWLAGDNRTIMNAIVADGAPDEVRPVRFSVRYRKPDRSRSIDLTYDEAGDLESVDVRHKGEPRSSRVPDVLQRDTVDPRTALVRVQAWLREPRAPGDSLRVPVFEGRKRADLDLRYLERRGDEHRLQASIVGLSGFDEGDSLVTAQGAPRRWLDVRTAVGRYALPIVIAEGGGRLRTEIRRTR